MSDDIPQFMDLTTLAAHLSMDAETVSRMVEEGALPRPKARRGRGPLWRWEDVDRMMTDGAANSCCVYFIEMNDLIKIGFTTNVRRRMVEIEYGLPYPISLLHRMPGGSDLELDLHRKFRHLRVKGEWFRKTDELLSFIDRVRTSDEPSAPNSRRLSV